MARKDTSDVILSAVAVVADAAAVFAGFLLAIIAVLLLYFGKGVGTFVISANIVGMLLVYQLAYQMGLIANYDVSGRVTVLITFVLASSGAVGPGVAGTIIEHHGYNIFYVGICAITLLSLLITFTAVFLELGETKLKADATDPAQSGLP